MVRGKSKNTEITEKNVSLDVDDIEIDEVIEADEVAFDDIIEKSDDKNTKSKVEKPKTKVLYNVIIEAMDFPPETLRGRIQWIVNGTLVDKPVDVPCEITATELESLRNAIAIDYIMTEGVPGQSHTTVVKRPRKRYRVEVLGKRVVREGGPPIINASEVNV